MKQICVLFLIGFLLVSCDKQVSAIGRVREIAHPQKPISGAEVVLYINELPKDTCVTDDSGVFRVSAISRGFPGETEKVAISKPGYVGFEFDVYDETLQSRAEDDNFVIYLDKK